MKNPSLERVARLGGTQPTATVGGDSFSLINSLARTAPGWHSWPSLLFSPVDRTCCPEAGHHGLASNSGVRRKQVVQPSVIGVLRY